MPTLRVILRDNDPAVNMAMPVAITINQNFIQIEVEGHNACGASDAQPIGEGNRSIIAMEIWQGQFRSIHWADINQEDPTSTIDYAQARISNRDCYYCGGDCHRDPEYACDGHLGDIDGLYVKEVAGA